jgi:hypothetical protein
MELEPRFGALSSYHARRVAQADARVVDDLSTESSDLRRA